MRRTIINVFSAFSNLPREGGGWKGFWKYGFPPSFKIAMKSQVCLWSPTVGRDKTKLSKNRWRFFPFVVRRNWKAAQMSSYLRRPEVIENLTVSRSRPGITFCMCWEYYAPTAFSFGGTQNINTNSAYNVTQKPLLQRYTRNIKKDRFVYVVCTCLSSRFRFFNKGQLLVANTIVPWREEYLYAKPYCESPQRSLVTCTVVERFLNMVCRNLTPRYSRLKYISWTFLNETNHIKHSLVMYWRTFLSMYQELFRVDSLKAPEALTLTKQNNSILPSKRPCW